MSSRVDLRVSRSLELLASLKQTIAEFGRKEELLSRDIRTRRTASDRKFREASEKIETKLAKQIAETESVYKERENRIRATYDGRRARIQTARTAGLRNLPKRAQDAKKRWMGDLQMRHFRAERTLAAGFTSADAALAASTKKLTEQKSTLGALERRAHRSFGGYGKLMRMIAGARARAAESPHDPAERDQLLADLAGHLATLEQNLDGFRRLPMARIFAYLPPFVVIPLLLAAGGALVAVFGAVAYAPVGAAVFLLVVAVAVLHGIGGKQAAPWAGAVAGLLAEAGRLEKACQRAMDARYAGDRQRLQADFDKTSSDILVHWNRAGLVESEFENAARQKIEAQVPRAIEKNAQLMLPKLSRVEPERTALLEQIRSDAAARKEQVTTIHDAEVTEIVTAEQTRWDELQTAWSAEILPLYQAINEMNAATAPKFPAWDAQFVENWQPPTEFTPAAKFAHLDLDVAKRPEGPPRESRLALPGPAQVSIPLALTFPEQGSLLFETFESGGPAVMATMNNVILRLLATTPPGKLSFTIIDPVGLGENFAGVMHLSDYEESLINRRIWTQRDQVEERLAEMSEHIEKVIQMYLRNEYATITEYNEQAGSVAEKYHFLVVADFPANFSDVAAKRLQSIALSGPRCGIFTLVHWDQRQPMPDGFVPDELRKSSVCIRRDRGGEFTLHKEQAGGGAALVFDPPPDPDLAVALVHKIGKSSIDSNRVEVPFVQIAPKPDELWTNDTTTELRIPIGRTGATKLQYLAIGKGTRQHALFAGKTGSGKSTLFHVIITNLALACSPDQVEFYLIDFKKGVEFKCYAAKHLPHARVVAIESDREFGLNVLQRVDDELKRRGDLFRKLGVQDIAGYKRAGGTESIPRSLLIIDEFQEFFVDDDTIAQTASLLFDRIVRQGRAFGIHVLLGSQTLGGAYSLARATLGQMVIRVALQCNEADAYLIMDDTNSAPRLLSRPGEGIYNDAAGAVEGNSPFQVVWLPDEERDKWLDKVQDLAEQRHDKHPRPIVFEGNAPANIRENELLRTLLQREPLTAPAVGRCWLGAPNSIKGPTEAAFHRQSGDHLLIVGQRDEAALTMVGLSLLALAAQYPAGGARFLIHAGAPGTRDAEYLDQILEAIPHEVTVARSQEIGAVIDEIATEMKARSTGDEQAAEAPPIFLFIHGLHKFKKLRHEDDFSFSTSDSEAGPNSGAQLNDLISEGSSQGIHIIATVDTFNNVNRSMSRKALSEFEMRVVFQMSANDSASLIDSPKASNLGLHRALFYNEHEGTLETFRPYATPETGWLREIARKPARVPA